MDRLMTADPREMRLPQWAKVTLDGLRRELDRARQHAEDARLETEPDSSYVVVNRFMDPPIGLGVDPTITFLHEPGGRSIHGIDVRLLRSREYPRGRLDVSTGGMSLRISPAAANRVYVDWGYDL